jgi:hypothetical protein
MEMLAPTLAVQGLAQGAPASVIETLPRPAVAAAVITTVAGAKFAVSLSAVAGAGNVHGFVMPAHMPPADQPVNWLAGVARIEMASPVLAGVHGLEQGEPASEIATAPPPTAVAVIAPPSAAACARYCGGAPSIAGVPADARLNATLPWVARFGCSTLFPTSGAPLEAVILFPRARWPSASGLEVSRAA